MSMRLDFDTRKLQNYIKCKDIYIFEDAIITFFAILSEIWDLDNPHCINLEYKLVIMV